jgi:hypothetical protein
MISYDEGFKEGEVAFCGSVPHRGVLNRGGMTEIQEHHARMQGNICSSFMRPHNLKTLIKE